MTIYSLIGRDSVEEVMVERAKAKTALERAILERPGGEAKPLPESPTRSDAQRAIRYAAGILAAQKPVAQAEEVDGDAIDRAFAAVAGGAPAAVAAPTPKAVAASSLDQMTAAGAELDSKVRRLPPSFNGRSC